MKNIIDKYTAKLKRAIALRDKAIINGETPEQADDWAEYIFNTPDYLLQMPEDDNRVFRCNGCGNVSYIVAERNEFTGENFCSDCLSGFTTQEVRDGGGKCCLCGVGLSCNLSGKIWDRYIFTRTGWAHTECAEKQAKMRTTQK